MDKVLEKLVDNNSLALIVVGALIIVIGATGGWTSPSLTIRVTEVFWKIILVVVGLLIAGLGALPLLQDSESAKMGEQLLVFQTTKQNMPVKARRSKTGSAQGGIISWFRGIFPAPSCCSPLTARGGGMTS